MVVSVLSFWTVFDFLIDFSIVKILFIICMIFNIFVYKTYTFKKAIVHIVLTAMFWYISMNTHKFVLLNMWLYLLAIPPISFKKISKVVLITLSVAMIIILTLTVLGYGHNITLTRIGWLDRSSFGFLDPNIFAAYIFQICLALVYLRWKNFGTKDNLFLFAAFCLVAFFANCRTTSTLLLLTMLLVNISKFWCKNSLKFNYIASNLLLALCPILTFIMVKLYAHGVHFALAIDELTSYRLRNVCFCMATHPITLYGNLFHIRYDMHIMANVYGILFIRYGVVAFLLFMTAYAVLIQKSFIKKDIPLLIILSLGLVQALSEQYILFPIDCFVTLAFTGLVNNNELWD